MFERLYREMAPQVGLSGAFFYVTDRRYYERFVRQHPSFEAEHTVLKEWELVETALTRLAAGNGPDLKRLQAHEAQWGNPTLWNILVSERRVYHGAQSTFRDSRQPRFSHEQMLAILCEVLDALERVFADQKLEFVAAYQFVTLADYASALMAQRLGVRLLNLKSSKVRNYTYASDRIFEPAGRLLARYEQYLRQGVPAELAREAQEFIRSSREGLLRYEGVIPPSRNVPRGPGATTGVLALLRSLLGLARTEWRWRFSDLRYDISVQGALAPFWFNRVVRPLRARRDAWRWQRHWLDSEQLRQLRFAYLPLHTEPELSLSVYGRPYLNQIEAVRLLSHSLPVGMKLVLKEHPWGIGKRAADFYDRLLEIPNVLLADPALESKELIYRSALVVTISGTVSFESILVGRPVVVLGNVPFEALPGHLIRRARDPFLLPQVIQSLLAEHQLDDRALAAYVAACMSESEPVDFWSKLFGRTEGLSLGANRGDLAAWERERDEHFRQFAAYLARVAKEPRPEPRIPL